MNIMVGYSNRSGFLNAVVQYINDWTFVMHEWYLGNSSDALIFPILSVDHVLPIS